MEVVLIPCSGRKRRGGSPVFAHPAWLKARISPASAGRLLGARQVLAAFFSLEPGPDLGLAGSPSIPELLPASARYTGNVYRASSFSDLCPLPRGKAVMIVSALYGLVLPDDPIRHYDLAMDFKGPAGLSIANWWKRQRLGDLVAECVLSFGPTVVHDLLSGNYRKALAPWPGPELKEITKQYGFPGLGIGADHARGKLLRNILEQT